MKNLPGFWQNDQKNVFRAMSEFQRQMDRMFGNFWEGAGSIELPVLSSQALQAPCDIEESENHYLMTFDLPGIRKEDIKVEISNNQLRVSGERKDERKETQGNRTRSERYYGTFERVVAIPPGVKAEQVETHFENGVLKVAVPKVEAAQAKQIPVSDQKSGFFSKLVNKKENKVA